MPRSGLIVQTALEEILVLVARPPPTCGPFASGRALRYGRMMSLMTTGPSGRIPRLALSSGTKLEIVLPSLSCNAS
jgi:hypothetical protein